MSRVLKNILRDFSCFAFAVKYTFMYKEKKEDLYLIRSSYRPEYFRIPGVVVCYSDIICNDQEMYNFLKMGVGTIMRVSLDRCCYYSITSLRKVMERRARKRFLGLTTLKTLQWLKEVLEEKDFFAWNCEPSDSWVLNFTLSYSNQGKKACYPLTGKVTEDSAYIKAPIEMFARVKAMRDIIISLSTETDKKKNNSSQNYAGSSMSDLTSFLTECENTMSMDLLDRYQRTRHEVLNSTIRSLLGLKNLASDERLSDHFKYFGLECMKTPDIIYYSVEEQKHYLLDVQVTSMAVDYAYNLKVAKYQLAASSIEEALGIDVVSEAVIISCKLMGQMTFPSILDNSLQVLQDLQAALINIHTEVESYAGYKEAKKALEDKKSEEERIGMVDNMRVFLDSYLSFHTIENVKACSMDCSYEAANNSQNMEMVTNEEDRMVQEIKSKYSTFDKDAYSRATYRDLKQMLVNKTHPASLEGTYAEYDAMALVRSLESEQMALRLRKTKEKHFKIPKIFRFPDLMSLGEDGCPHSVDFLGSSFDTLGTDVYRYKPKYEMFEEEYQVNREGIGSDRVEDEEAVNLLVDRFSKPSSLKFQEDMMVAYPDADEKMKAMFSISIYELAYKISRLARNIVYMEGRRLDRSDKYTVYRAFKDEGYGLAVKAGSRLTEDSQVRYKVISFGEECTTYGFHSMKDVFPNGGVVSTKWLSASTSDLETMVLIFEKCISLSYHYMECHEESMGMEIPNLKDFLKQEMMIFPLLAMLEMKRGTSLALQYNRYVFMSMSSYMSDSRKTIEDIFSDPTRSVLASFVKLRQLDWALNLRAVRSKIVLHSMMSLYKNSSDYDRFMVPTIFSRGKEVEFSVIMNDIYMGNLYQKEIGFAGHRAKPIVEKMVAEERHFQSIKDRATMNGDLTFDKISVTKNTKHMFSMDFMFLIGTTLREKLKADPKYHEQLMKGATVTMHDAMTMKSSLLQSRGKFETITCLGVKKTDICHSTINQLIMEHGTTVAASLVSKENMIEAIFSSFPKINVQGPREILIQSYKLRAPVRMMERVFERLCELTEKDMITDKGNKEFLQSSKASELRNLAQTKKDSTGEVGVLFNYIADASKWSPSFVMPQFVAFILALELPKELEELFITIIRSFFSKMVMIPESLMKKWMTKPLSVAEDSEDAEWARKMSSSNDWILRIISSSGQGMFHLLTSAMHVAKDDVTDAFLHKIAKDMGINLEMFTQISSDDTSKQILATSKDIRTSLDFFPLFLDTVAYTGELANIHINTKKTQITPHVGEFNSNFTRGKRAIQAVIKDIFNATQVVDMTEPRKAVKSTLDNISRAYRNGAYNKTVRCMFILMRKWLMVCYTLKENTVADLKALLSCSEQDLPSDLGFLSLKHYEAQCVLGNDILMYDPDISENLKTFYRNIYTGTREEVKETVSEDYISSLSGRISVTLPYRADKTMMNKMKDHFVSRGITRDQVMELLEETALFSDHSNFSWVKHRIFDWAYFMRAPRDYEQGVSMKLHSIVRALQFGGRNLKTRPKINDDENTSVQSFVTAIMSRSHIGSSMEMMAPNNAIMKKVLEAEDIFASCNPSEGQRHTRKRKMVFRTKEVSMTADIDDIMNFIMGDNTKFSNRLLAVVDGVCEMCGMDANEFKTAPINTILKLFSFTKYPMFCFRTFLEEFVSNRTNLSVEIMVSSVDKGNIVDNLVALHCEREYPYQLLKPDKSAGLGDLRDLFETWVSISRDPLRFPKSLIPKSILEDDSFYEVRTSDGLMERGLKMIMGRINDSYVSSNHIFTRSHKENASKFGKGSIMSYYDLSNLILVRYDHDNKIAHHEFMTSERVFNVSGQIMKVYSMDYLMETKGEYKKLYYDKGKAYSSFMQSSREFREMLTCSFNLATWSLWLKLSWDVGLEFYDKTECKFNIFNSRYNIHTSALPILKAGEGMSDFIDKFSRFRFQDMTLLEIQDFLEENKLYTDRPITRRQDRSRTLDDFYDTIGEEMENFCMMEENIHTLPCFNFSIDQRMIDVMNEIQDRNEEISFGWVTDEMLDLFNEEVSREEDDSERHVDPHERIHMGSMIVSSIGEAFKREMFMNEADLAKLFSRKTKNSLNSKDAIKEASMYWSSITTQIHHSDKRFKDWFVRLLVCYVYMHLSRKRKIRKPKEIILSNRAPTLAWIKRADFEEAVLEMYQHFEEDFPELEPPVVKPLATDSASTLVPEVYMDVDADVEYISSSDEE
jgi:hypothetical protein